MTEDTDLHSGRSLAADGRTMTIREFARRHPGEDRQVVVTPDAPVKQAYTDARRWRYVFTIRDWTDRVRLDGDGPHAVLTYLYAPDEDAPPAGPEGYATIAVNGGTRVPDAILTALMDTLDLNGFGRPPFIPERDGEPLSPNPEWVKPTDSEGIQDG
jgi:hypothetical protein